MLRLWRCAAKAYSRYVAYVTFVLFLFLLYLVSMRLYGEIKMIEAQW